MGKDKFCELEKESNAWLGVWRVLVQEMFQGREAMGMGDVGVQGGDFNSSHDGVKWEGGGLGLNRVKEVVSILDMGGEGFHKWLEVGVNEGRGTFSRGTIGGDDGAAGIARFVNFRE